MIIGLFPLRKHPAFNSTFDLTQQGYVKTTRLGVVFTWLNFISQLEPRQ